MSKPNPNLNQQPQQSATPNRFQIPQTPPQMTEEKVKEVIIETLIELGLVPQPQRKKALPDVQPTTSA
jgi:hypothetical protein